MGFFVEVVLPTAGLITAITIGYRVVARFHGVRRHAVAHLGRPSPACFSSSSSHHTWEGPDLQLALERLAGEDRTVRLSFDPGYQITDVRFVIEPNRRHIGDSYLLVPNGPDSSVPVPQHVLYLLKLEDGQPYCAAVFEVEAHGKPRTFSLSVLARTQENARRALDLIVATAREHSRFRGKVVAIEAPARPEDAFQIRFQALTPAAPSEIVLPKALLQVIKRNTIDFLDAAERLTAAGRSLRHGVLFHGVPGVGKTLVVRYLAAAKKGHTVFVLTGRNLQYIRESLSIAKELAPCVVVFEDIDLVAGERSENHAAGILHELLDELDGIGPRTPCLVLLTTNRPEILEPALVLRPGRVDQAIEFPLPDAQCRERLFALYGKGLDITSLATPVWVERLDGATPAFICELIRKATMMAIERGEEGTPLRIIERDMSMAHQELVAASDPLTRKLLGYRTGRSGARGAEPGQAEGTKSP